LFFCAGQVVLTEAIFTLKQMQLRIRQIRQQQAIDALECHILLMGLPILFNITRLVVCYNNYDNKHYDQN
jgi:hypothetical protein